MLWAKEKCCVQVSDTFSNTIELSHSFLKPSNSCICRAINRLRAF